MSSYPKRAKEFEQWAKAMLRGATVGTPTYSSASRKPKRRRKKRFATSKKRKKKSSD